MTVETNHSPTHDEQIPGQHLGFTWILAEVAVNCDEFSNMQIGALVEIVGKRSLPVEAFIMSAVFTSHPTYLRPNSITA